MQKRLRRANIVLFLLINFTWAATSGEASEEVTITPPQKTKADILKDCKKNAEKICTIKVPEQILFLK